MGGNQAALGGAAIGVMLCSLVFGLALGCLIGAVILRAAIAAYNGIAGKGSPSRVPEPSFGKGMGMVLLAAIGGIIAQMALQLAMGVPLIDPNPGEISMAKLLPSILSLPIGCLIFSAILTAMLPTSFGRAILVSLLYYVIIILIMLLIGGGLLMLGFLAMAGGAR